MAEPIIAPLMPPKHIIARYKKFTSGTVWVANVVIRPVSCENRMIKREFLAVSFACVEKKKDKITMLTGPPPIPRKDELTPRIKPMITHTSLFFICIVFMPDFLIRYKSTSRFMISSSTDCISFTFAMALEAITENTILPSQPPAQAPRVSHRVVA